MPRMQDADFFHAVHQAVDDGFFDQPRAVSESQEKLSKYEPEIGERYRDSVRLFLFKAEEKGILKNVGTPTYNEWVRPELEAEVRRKQQRIFKNAVSFMIDGESMDEAVTRAFSAESKET